MQPAGTPAGEGDDPPPITVPHTQDECELVGTRNLKQWLGSQGPPPSARNLASASSMASSTHILRAGCAVTCPGRHFDRRHP